MVPGSPFQDKSTSPLSALPLPMLPTSPLLIPAIGSPRPGSSSSFDGKSMSSIDSDHRSTSPLGMDFQDTLHESFWATTSILLGPDFDLDAEALTNRSTGLLVFQSDPAPLKRRKSDSDLQNAKDRSTKLEGARLKKNIESLGMSWRWFTDATAVQTFMHDELPERTTWDFGVCFERLNKTRHCVVMKARGKKRKFMDHLHVREGVSAGRDVLGAGSRPRFWWCRPHHTSSEMDERRVSLDTRMDDRYEDAKRRILAAKEKKIGAEIALQHSRDKLLKDLHERKRSTGRYSIKSMNTILQLGSICETLGNLEEAARWNGQLVKLRAHRLGQKSHHTCYARYRQAELLIKMEKYDDAIIVARENVKEMLDFSPSHALVWKQNIQACVISMKRRRIDQALEVEEHLWNLEKWHPEDLVTKDTGFEVAVEAYTFRREYNRVEKYLRKQIALYETGYGLKRRKADCQYRLSICLTKQAKLEQVVLEIRSCITTLKECELGPKDDSILDAYALLGQTHFALREWNKAKYYCEKVVEGYTAVLGSKNEKTKKAKGTLSSLNKAIKIKAGLADRLLKHSQKTKKVF